MTERIVWADCEGNGFLPELTKMWTLQIAKTVDGPVGVYADQPGYPPIAEGLEVLKAADKVVMHFGLGYDFWAINKLYPGTLRWDQVIDSVIISRLINSESNRHKLEDLGEALGFRKGTFKDFSRFSEEMVKYGRQDVVILQKAWTGVQGKKVYPFGKFYEKFRRACDLEMKTAYIIEKQHQHGVRYDYEGGLVLEATLRQEKIELERELQEIFPTIVTPRFHKTTGKPIKPNVEVFNPGSNDQIAERLIAKYGWKPRKKTKTGKAKLDEEVLAELSFPEAKKILEYKNRAKMLGQLADGDNAWAKLAVEQPDGSYRVHGSINTLGARTHRMSHYRPNMAQVARDERMRALWLPN